ncbi:MAG TPA: TnpV protein [Erysipelotrichaceae bacterium]|nr:TnpV protein [Erysipelotrichaceae bacterium]
MSELNYLKSGDYLIPDVKLTQTEQTTTRLGKYGRMRRTFLKEHRPMTYSDMALSETLFPHLIEVQETAQRRIDQIMKELIQSNPAPDRKTDSLGWAAHMNSLKAVAEENVMTELIYA